MPTTIGKYIEWENLDWSKLNAHERKMYARMLDERRNQVMWNRIKILAVALPVLFIIACSVKVATEPEPYPEFCYGVESWERGNFCNVFYD